MTDREAAEALREMLKWEQDNLKFVYPHNKPIAQGRIDALQRAIQALNRAEGVDK